MPARSPEARTLGEKLERDRLHHRAARLELVVAALRVRARAYDESAAPRPLRLSLAEFQDELAAVRARLDETRDGAAAASAAAPVHFVSRGARAAAVRRRS